MNVLRATAGVPLPSGPSPTPRATAGRSFLEVLGETSAPRASAGARPAATAPVHKTPRHAAQDTPAWRTLVDGALKGEKEIDGILKAAASGKTFSPTELLAMQTQVFRYSQTVELLSRATDKLVGAVKQTLGTQV